MINIYKKDENKGFTLVEVIVTLVILAILAAFMIPALSGYIDTTKGMSSVSEARQAYVSAAAGLTDWKASGSPGNGDNAYKINIEQEIIKYLELGDMKSYTSTKGTENVVQVALSLPSAYSQGWASFINDCNNNNYKNFVRVWVGKNSDKTIGNSIKAIYYITPDGKYVSRIVYDGTTKLGSTDQGTGAYSEQIK